MLEKWNRWLGEHPRWAAASLFLTTYVVFGGTLSNLFVHDDIPQILENPFLRLPRLWTRIFTGSVWSFRGPEQRDNMYRPLQFICYWVLYRLKGPNPFIFHFAMLAFYAAVVWLAYRLACQLLPSALFAFAGTLLWALHPLHVETVAWISALPDMGASFFYLLAFLFFLRADRSTSPSIQGHGLAALAFLPALFFKEMALSFPILLLVYWFFLPGKTSWGRKLLYGAVYLVPIVFYSIVRIKVLGSFTETGKAHQSAPRLAEVAIALLGQHAKLFFWPRYLSLFRSFDLATSLHSPWPWMVAISILGALLLRNHAPLAGFLISWWVVTLLPTLDVRQVNLPVADRFSFLPSLGPCLVLAWFALDWMPQHLHVPAPALAGALGVIAIIWSAQDLRSVPRWHDNVSLWDQAYLASPNSALAHMLHGVVLQQRDAKFEEAASEYRRAIQLNLASERPLVGVATDCYVMLGQIANIRGHSDEAIADYNQALQIAPGNAQAYRALGILYFPHGQYAQSKGYFQKVVALSPDDLEAKFFLGTCLLKLGDPLGAAGQFRAAHEADSTYYQAFEAEAKALDAAGDKAGAARVRASVPKH